MQDDIMEQKVKRNKQLSDNLKKLRGRSGLSQEKLCVQLQRMGCDIGRSTYAKYESSRLNIKAEVIVALKDFYGCSYEEFFEGIKIFDEDE